MRIELRRFRCTFRDGPRKTYVERLPLVMGSRTVRLSEIIRIGYAPGGGRLANRLRLETSPDSVRHRLKSGPIPPLAAPVAVVGVDEGARRRHVSTAYSCPSRS